MIKAVFFDLGGTLIYFPEDTKNNFLALLQSQLEKLGYKRSLDDLSKVWTETWTYVEKNYRALRREI